MEKTRHGRVIISLADTVLSRQEEHFECRIEGIQEFEHAKSRHEPPLELKETTAASLEESDMTHCSCLKIYLLSGSCSTTDIN